MAGLRLPDLGPRGEGWLAIQTVLSIGVFLAGFTGPVWHGVPRAGTVVIGVILIGAGLVLVARAMYDLGESMTPMPRPRAGGRLVETGAYRLVRHPIYGGVILLGVGWGLLMAAPLALAATLLLAAFLDIKSRREELWLVERFPEYEAYRRRTRRLIPSIY
jgi:protein-S-isoprenylcysteine O-methyltransferase Ste14